MNNATQQRVDRLVVQNRDKDLIIQNLEKQLANLDQTLKEVTASTAKAGLVGKKFLADFFLMLYYIL